MSYEIIIPFLKPIKHLLASTTISEIMVNPDSSVWIEEAGHVRFMPEISLTTARFKRAWR